MLIGLTFLGFLPLIDYPPCLSSKAGSSLTFKTCHLLQWPTASRRQRRAGLVSPLYTLHARTKEAVRLGAAFILPIGRDEPNSKQPLTSGQR